MIGTPRRAVESTSLTRVTGAAVDHIAMGAAVLGSGGGGRLDVVQALAHQTLDSGDVVAVVRADELAESTWVAHVALMGAPLAMTEKLPTGVELSMVATALAERRGVELGAIGCLQIGGQNALAAVLAAYHLGLPVVDGDLMGRAFPRLDQTVLTAAGHAATPLGLLDPGGNLVLMETDDIETAKRIAGTVVVSMGGWAALGVHLVRAGVLVRDGIAGSLSLAAQVGRALVAGRDLAPVELAATMNADLLVHGTIVEIRRTHSAMDPSVLVLVDPDHPSDVARVDMLQEYLAVAVNGEVVATVPDVLCLIADSGAVVDLESLRLGQPVSVLRLACDPKWTTAAGLDISGPASFGLALDPVVRGARVGQPHSPATR